jgi:predicted DCC family thiol-disulfide oxidoreductase YuxK
MNNMGITVYFDGLCPLCSREINHYRHQVGAEQINFCDITDANFNAKQEGVDPFLVHKVMHVKKANGSLSVGVHAFIEIWQTLPKYRWAARAAKNPIIFFFLHIAYQIFAKIRPLLPRKTRECEASPFCEIKGKK